MCRSAWSILRIRSSARSWDVWKINVGRHAGTKTIVIIRQSDFDAEDLFDAVFDSLHITRRKLGLAIDLLDSPWKIDMRKRIDTDADLLAKFDFAEPRFRHVNAHPKVLWQQQRRDFAIRRQHVASFHAQHFENRLGRRD